MTFLDQCRDNATTHYRGTPAATATGTDKFGDWLFIRMDCEDGAYVLGWAVADPVEYPAEFPDFEYEFDVKWEAL